MSLSLNPCRKGKRHLLSCLQPQRLCQGGRLMGPQATAVGHNLAHPWGSCHARPQRQTLHGAGDRTGKGLGASRKQKTLPAATTQATVH